MEATIVPTTAMSHSRASRRLAWSRRLSSPFTVLGVALVTAGILWAVLPTAAVALRKRFPTNMVLRTPKVEAIKMPVLSVRNERRESLPLPLRPPPYTPESSEHSVPAAVPPRVRSTTLPLSAGTPTATPAARPLVLPCRVTASGAVAGPAGEWQVELILDATALDARGASVLTKGTRAKGRVRLERNGGVATWPTTWQVSIPEDSGSREVELTALYEPQTGGIAVGATGRWAIQAVNRVGDRQDAAMQEPAADRPPVSILTNRNASEADSDLPKP